VHQFLSVSNIRPPFKICNSKLKNLCNPSGSPRAKKIRKSESEPAPKINHRLCQT
jgi:hypothetical protein